MNSSNGHNRSLVDQFSAYRNLFAQAFPEVPPAELGFQHAANAISAFEVDSFRALNSPFDRYVAGDDTAFTDAQKRGGLLFYGGARCAQCHRGGLLSDQQFHNIASPQVGPGTDPTTSLDLGRFSVTGVPNTRFAFKTPILRNVAQTGPWMHSGAYTTLTAAVAHYRNPAQSLRNYNPNQLRADLRGEVHTADQLNAGILNTLDPLVNAPINLNQGDVADIVAFLESLTDPNATNTVGIVPPSVPSGLPVTP